MKSKPLPTWRVSFELEYPMAMPPMNFLDLNDILVNLSLDHILHRGMLYHLPQVIPVPTPHDRHFVWVGLAAERQEGNHLLVGDLVPFPALGTSCPAPARCHSSYCGRQEYPGTMSTDGVAAAPPVATGPGPATGSASCKTNLYYGSGARGSRDRIHG